MLEYNKQLDHNLHKTQGKCKSSVLKIKMTHAIHSPAISKLDLAF